MAQEIFRQGRDHGGAGGVGCLDGAEEMEDQGGARGLEKPG